MSWFQNLSDYLGENMKIRIASKDGQPIAGMLTLLISSRWTYKYGCSDARYHNLGGMAFLFWKTIQEAKRSGLEELDMGRSDLESAGLVTFKEHWGAERMTLKYWRYPASDDLEFDPVGTQAGEKDLYICAYCFLSDLRTASVSPRWLMTRPWEFTDKTCVPRT